MLEILSLGSHYYYVSLSRGTLSSKKKTRHKRCSQMRDLGSHFHDDVPSLLVSLFHSFSISVPFFHMNVCLVYNKAFTDILLLEPLDGINVL